MPTITVINERGEYEQREVLSREATIETQTQSIGIAVPQRVEFDHEGAMSQIMTVCGETENRREGDKKPDLTVEGVITEDQLEPIKNLHRGQEIIFISDVDSNSVVIKRVTVEQNSDLVHYTPDGGERQLAFSVQLQLKYPE